MEQIFRIISNQGYYNNSLSVKDQINTLWSENDDRKPATLLQKVSYFGLENFIHLLIQYEVDLNQKVIHEKIISYKIFKKILIQNFIIIIFFIYLIKKYN